MERRKNLKKMYAWKLWAILKQLLHIPIYNYSYEKIRMLQYLEKSDTQGMELDINIYLILLKKGQQRK